MFITCMFISCRKVPLRYWYMIRKLTVLIVFPFTHLHLPACHFFSITTTFCIFAFAIVMVFGMVWWWCWWKVIMCGVHNGVCGSKVFDRGLRCVNNSDIMNSMRGRRFFCVFNFIKAGCVWFHPVMGIRHVMDFLHRVHCVMINSRIIFPSLNSHNRSRSQKD